MTLQHFTIADLQRALHDGELSAREIARQTLDDIARVNPQINAWTEVTAQRMLAEADSIDALRREKRPLPPLAGIGLAALVSLMLCAVLGNRFTATLLQPTFCAPRLNRPVPNLQKSRTGHPVH